MKSMIIRGKKGRDGYMEEIPWEERRPHGGSKRRWERRRRGRSKRSARNDGWFPKRRSCRRRMRTPRSMTQGKKLPTSVLFFFFWDRIRVSRVRIGSSAGFDERSWNWIWLGRRRRQGVRRARKRMKNIW